MLSEFQTPVSFPHESQVTRTKPVVFLVGNTSDTKSCVLFSLLLYRRVCFIRGIYKHRIAGEWRRVHSDKLYTLYSSTNIIPVTKSRRVR